MAERLCEQCYSCLAWQDGKCEKGRLSVPGRCAAYEPIPDPEPCELEPGILFVEVDKL